jgi:hypothetical protein
MIRPRPSAFADTRSPSRRPAARSADCGKVTLRFWLITACPRLPRFRSYFDGWKRGSGGDAEDREWGRWESNPLSNLGTDFTDRPGSPTPALPRPGSDSRERFSTPYTTSSSWSQGAISNSAYLYPPSVTLVSPPIAPAGISHRLPSATSAKRRSNRDASNFFATPLQLWLPPFVAIWTGYRRYPAGARSTRSTSSPGHAAAIRRCRQRGRSPDSDRTEATPSRRPSSTSRLPRTRRSRPVFRG